MSIQARQALVASPNTIFQKQSQRDDLLSPETTQTGLIALLSELVDKGHIIEFTAIKSDHHNDSDLNPTPPHEGTHFGGFAADCWPLASTRPGDYLDAGDGRFQAFLRDCASAAYLFQIGLAGSALAAVNRQAAGPTCFPDDGGDHVHIGVRAA